MMLTYSMMTEREEAMYRALETIVDASEAPRPGLPNYMSKAEMGEVARRALRDIAESILYEGGNAKLVAPAD